MWTVWIRITFILIIFESLRQSQWLFVAMLHSAKGRPIYIHETSYFSKPINIIKSSTDSVAGIQLFFSFPYPLWKKKINHIYCFRVLETEKFLNSCAPLILSLNLCRNLTFSWKLLLHMSQPLEFSMSI